MGDTEEQIGVMKGKANDESTTYQTNDFETRAADLGNFNIGKKGKNDMNERNTEIKHINKDDKCSDLKWAYLEIYSECLNEIELISKNLCQFITNKENDSMHHVD